MLSLFGSGHVFQLIPSTSCHISFQTRVCIRTACELMSRIVCAFETLLHCRSLQHNVTLQRTLPCTSHPEPRSNATRMLQSPATKCRTGAALVLRHSVTLQRTLPCTSHPEPRSNATRMLQSPATKCHTGFAPATQRHTATYMQRTIPCTSHPEPRSNATRMLQSTAPATKCHTGAAPATQRHNSTYHSLHQPHRSTLQLEVSRVQASQFHVYKRANFTCTSEPAP